jgi:hypothetical protein
MKPDKTSSSKEEGEKEKSVRKNGKEKEQEQEKQMVPLMHVHLRLKLPKITGSLRTPWVHLFSCQVYILYVFMYTTDIWLRP